MGVFEKFKKETLNDEISENKHEIMNRLENYFKNTNSLPLIGF